MIVDVDWAENTRWCDVFLDLYFVSTSAMSLLYECINTVIAGEFRVKPSLCSLSCAWFVTYVVVCWHSFYRVFLFQLCTVQVTYRICPNRSVELHRHSKMWLSFIEPTSWCCHLKIQVLDWSCKFRCDSSALQGAWFYHELVFRVIIYLRYILLLLLEISSFQEKVDALLLEHALLLGHLY